MRNSTDDWFLFFLRNVYVRTVLTAVEMMSDLRCDESACCRVVSVELFSPKFEC